MFERPRYSRTNSSQSTRSDDSEKEREKDGRGTPSTVGRLTPRVETGNNTGSTDIQAITTAAGSYITWDLKAGSGGTSPMTVGPVGDVLYATFQLKPRRESFTPKIEIPGSIHTANLRQPSPLARAVHTGLMSPRALTPPRPAQLELPTNQELMQIYLEITAPRLADTSPLHIDLFKTHIPAMAQEQSSLLEAILGLAAVQAGLLRKDSRIISAYAPMHYEWALRGHFRVVADPEAMKTDVPLATSLLLAFYELWNGELVKMGIHMLGGRNIILARGKEMHKTTIGRALLATFVRTDIGTSTITGNPCFMTNEWWNVDPLIRAALPNSSDLLFAADAALAKLCVICNKLTHLKRWALDHRRKIWVASQTELLSVIRQRKIALDESIEKKTRKLEEALEEWYEELPAWFRPNPGENDSDEDINDPLCPEILPKPYPHTAVALTLSMSYAAQLQLFRIAHPSQPVLPSHLGSLVHSILRAFEFVPSTADVSMLPWVFTAGIELRHINHQQHLLRLLTSRVEQTGLYAITFVRDGLAFAYAKLAGAQSGRFLRVKEDATVRFPGISENMWNAEGVLGQLEALSLYDSEDLSEERWNYKGDFEPLHTDEVVPYELNEDKDHNMMD